MKALQIRNYGGKEVLEVDFNASTPMVGNEQLLIEVRAASLNPIDWKIRQGYLKDSLPLKMPATLGGDFSGTVKDVGSSKLNLKAGDKVYGYASPLAGGSGSFTKSAAVMTSAVARAPQKASDS